MEKPFDDMTIAPKLIIAGPVEALPRCGWRRKNKQRWLPMAALASAFVHVAVLVMIGCVVRTKAKPEAPTGSVELLMVERKGADPSNVPSVPNQATTDGSKPQVTQAASAEPIPSAVVAEHHGSDPRSNASEQKPEARSAEPHVADTTSPSPSPLVMQMGTDSDTNADVVEGAVLPASLDDRHPNRAPPYPDDAAARGEQGEVVVLIHVTAAGRPGGADVIQSSGSASLDRAALTAVGKWRFHPAMRSGQPVPFDMAIRFDFRPF